MSYGDLGQQATSRSRPTSSLAVGCSTQQRSYILTPDCLTRASVSPCARKLRTRAEFSTGGGNIILRREIRSSETQKVKKPRCLEGGAAGGEVEFSQQGACLSSIVLHAALRLLPATAARLGREVGGRAFRVGLDSSRDGSVAGSERLITFNANRPPLRVVLCDEAPHASVPVGLRCWSACGMRHAGSCLRYLLYHISFFFLSWLPTHVSLVVRGYLCI